MVFPTLSTLREGGGEAPVVVLPEVPVGERSKKHVILTSWASVATALLLVVLIGGAFYTAELKSRECKVTHDATTEGRTKDYSRTFENDGEKTKEDFHLDEADQTELIVKKSKDGNIEMIIGTDYKRKIAATYVPADDQCLLLAGVDTDWVNDMNAEKNKTIVVNNEEYEEEDYKVSGNKVTDLSILPEQMKVYCRGKETYWLQPDDSYDEGMDEDVGRVKRCERCRTCWYVTVTINGNTYTVLRCRRRCC